jgi:hypothetical protein
MRPTVPDLPRRDPRRRVSLRRAAAVAVTLVAGLLGTPRGARGADPPPTRLTGIGIRNGQMVVSVGLADLFGPAERAHLTSGFSTRVLIRVALLDEAADETVALAVQRGEIVYDIWDEKFSVRTTRGLGAELRVLAGTADEAIWRATALTQLAVVDTARLKAGGQYVVLVRGDLNPLSEDLLADVRRWLVQPARGQRKLGTGDSFFGSFVSIFVNPRIEDSERQVRFTSQPFTLPAPLPPAPPLPTLPPRTGGAAGKGGKAKP